MNSNLLSQSETMSHEYCCTIVKLGEIIPIEGANTVAKTLVNGREIVIDKDRKEGDLMCYVSNECQLNFDFMSVNNLFQDYTLNSNSSEIVEYLSNHSGEQELIDEYLRTHTGYFDKRCRVRMKKLCKTLSMGFLFEPELLIKWCPKLKDFNFESFVGEDFDLVNGELFVKAYVPPIKEGTPRKDKAEKREAKLRKFDRLIPGQFILNYDSQQLERNIQRINSDDWITISVKLHGTSAVIGNVLTKVPRWSGWYTKYFNRFPKFLQFTKNKYDVIYSSRHIIKNKDINESVTSGYYDSDVWGEYYMLLKNYIPKGFTIYGEIVGYVGGSNKMIQKGFDYKCNPGENKLMIYRVSHLSEDGVRYEYNVNDVRGWTLKLIDSLKEDGNDLGAKKIHPIDILYSGYAGYLYKLDVTNHWHENFLQALKDDKERLGMELNEPLCRNITPREGICLRIDNDPINENFKLKCLKFLKKEAESMDKGETSDAEMQERYG